MRVLVYIAPRVHPNIYGRIECELDKIDKVICYTSNGVFSYNKNNLSDLYQTASILPRGKIDKLRLLFFLLKLWFKGFELKILYRDAYSFFDFLIIFLFKKSVTIIYQHKLQDNWKLWKLLYFFFNVQSNVINRLAQPGTKYFYPLYPSKLINEFINNKKYSSSIVIVSKYEERKRIEDAIKLCTGLFETITVIGVIKNLEYYNNLKRTYPTINFYFDLLYVDCLELMSKHENYLLYSDNEPAAVSPLEAVILGLNVFVRANNGTNDYFICGCEIVDSDQFTFSKADIRDLQYRKYTEILKKHGIINLFQK